MHNRLYVCLVLCSISFTTHASHFYYGFNYLYLDYTEKMQAPQTSDEYGLLIGATIGHIHIAPRKLFNDLSAVIAYGNPKSSVTTKVLAPNSQAQVIREKNASVIANLDSKFGYNFSPTKKKDIAPFIGGGFHYWYRAIGFSTRDRYYWPYLSYGIVTNFKINANWSAGVNLKLMHMINGKIIANMHPIKKQVNGINDYETLKLGNKMHFEVEFPITCIEKTECNGKKYNIIISYVPYYKYMPIGRSNYINATIESSNVPILIYNPASTTHIVGLKLLFSIL